MGSFLFFVKLPPDYVRIITDKTQSIPIPISIMPKTSQFTLEVLISFNKQSFLIRAVAICLKFERIGENSGEFTRFRTNSPKFLNSHF